MNKKIWLSSPHIGGKEFEFVKDAFDTNWIAPLGPHVNGFEDELAKYTRVKYVAALSSGTSAIHLALILLGVKRSDEVICQSFTFSASANPIVYQGATPVFIDSETDTWNMDPVLLEDAIKDRISKGKKPKAIIVVHLYGMPAKMNEIISISKKYGIPIIEDAAEALGSRQKSSSQNSEISLPAQPRFVNEEGRQNKGKKKGKEEEASYRVYPEFDEGRSMKDGWKMCGSFGLMSILSFNGNKIITTSGGGALLSNNKKFIEKARFLATQARDSAPHYQHSHIGYNYRMSNVLAAIGRGQLTVLEKRVEQRRHNFEFYRNAFANIEGIEFQPELKNNFSNRWLSCITVDPKITNGITREDIRLALEKENIEARPLWKPMHLQPVFKDAPKYVNGNSEKLFKNGLCLPSGSNLTQTDLEREAKTIKKVLNK